MKKYLIGSSVAMALPFLAIAASFTNVSFDNGDVTVQGTGGSTVNATFRVVVPAGQVVERIETDVLGDSLAPVCTEVGGSLGLQEGTHDVTLSVKLPPNTGTYNLQVRGSGIYGAFHTVDCTNDNVGTANFASALKVVADANSNTGGSSSTPSWFTAWLLSMGFGSTPAPVVKTQCTALNAKLVGTVDNTYNSANVKLQGFLLSEGASIPALEAGASFGFKGPQTNAAVALFKVINNCN